MNCAKPPEFKAAVSAALKEDIGRGDITTNTYIPRDKKAKAVLLAKEDCVVCGLQAARLAFQLLDKNARFRPLVKDGQKVRRGKVIARIEARARAILTAERVALNFISLLSGVATKTRVYVDKIKPYPAKIIDTRKTIPGLRLLQKYAVRMGGGCNHRFRLDELVMLKDNHLLLTERFSPRERFWGGRSVLVPWEIEVESVAQFRKALALRPDILMLDNMSINDMRQAVRIRNRLFPKASAGRPKLEASGGITLANVKKVASTGVDMISIGALTHSVDSVDISLEML
ncbi:MAG TPA: carboxylating nicotinate-nucleotide diphosphorylase [Patescibacteria group bacterium]|nr:carboxylating nicotinate-nucleotide diphosphorylase [Patescibacteria group bacterium]